MIKKVDIGIMVFGKPYQTAVSLYSLYENCKEHIGKIYVTLENKPVFDDETALIKKLLADLPIEYNVSKRYIGGVDLSAKTLKQYLKFFVPSYRKSIKYQYIWEKTTADYLFLLHNDMLFKGDIVSFFLEQISDDLAVGSIGQCWNCPAYQVHCNNDNYFEYRPSPVEIEALYKGWKFDRAVRQGMVGPDKEGWPLPECRLNEFAVMFNMKKCRKMVFPYGFVRPFGIHNNLDFGIPWFRDISHRGHKLKHTSYGHLAEHGWCSNHSGGTKSLSDKNLYETEERIAKEYFEQTYRKPA